MLAGEGLGGVLQALLAVAKVDGSRECPAYAPVGDGFLYVSDVVPTQDLALRLDVLDSSFADEDDEHWRCSRDRVWANGLTVMSAM